MSLLVGKWLTIFLLSKYLSFLGICDFIGCLLDTWQSCRTRLSSGVLHPDWRFLDGPMWSGSHVGHSLRFFSLSVHHNPSHHPPSCRYLCIVALYSSGRSVRCLIGGVRCFVSPLKPVASCACWAFGKNVACSLVLSNSCCTVVSGVLGVGALYRYNLMVKYCTDSGRPVLRWGTAFLWDELGSNVVLCRFALPNCMRQVSSICLAHFVSSHSKFAGHPGLIAACGIVLKCSSVFLEIAAFLLEARLRCCRSCAMRTNWYVSFQPRWSWRYSIGMMPTRAAARGVSRTSFLGLPRHHEIPRALTASQESIVSPESEIHGSAYSVGDVICDLRSLYFCIG